MAAEHFDAIIIGSGQAGKPLAGALAGAGRRTALIERAEIGGTCINTGCTPTKTMVASGRVAALARRGANYGVKTGPVEIDMLRIRERKRAIVKSFREGGEKRLKETKGLEVIFGEACVHRPEVDPCEAARRRRADGECRSDLHQYRRAAHHP